MKRIHADRTRIRRDRAVSEDLPADPRDPDVVRAKALLRAKALARARLADSSRSDRAN